MPHEPVSDGISRRSFLQWFGIGTTATALELAVPLRVLAAADPDQIAKPTLTVVPGVRTAAPSPRGWRARRNITR